MANRSGIHIKKSHEGRLHRRLGIPEDKPIPHDRLIKAAHSHNESLRSEAQFALNAEKFHHGHR